MTASSPRRGASRILDRIASQSPLAPALVMGAMVLLIVSQEGATIIFAAAILVIAALELGLILVRRRR